MATYVKIVAGNLAGASLQETLAASWKDSLYADLTIKVFPSTSHVEQRQKSLRANTSVVAAASPVLKSILRETGPVIQESQTLIFAGYHPDAVSSFFHFLYQGQTVLGTEVEDFKELLREFGVSAKPAVLPITNTAPVRRTRDPENRIIIQREIVFSDSHNLLPDQTVDSSRYESMCNPDSLRQSSLLEKSALKYHLLPPDVVNPRRVSQLDWLVRRTSPDHIGIYWDSSLHKYYENLVRSLPPFRIFLQIDTEPFRDENVTVTARTRPVLSYGKGFGSQFVTRKTVGNQRLPALSICRVGGKFHVVLGNSLSDNTDVDHISSIGVHDVDVDTCQQDEQQVSEVLGEEMRRKRVLHSTLSRLKRDYLNAKRVARDILRSCREFSDYGNQAKETDGKTDAAALPKPTSRKRTKTVCEVCGKLVTSSWLQAHMANHRGNKPYLCEHCGRSFATNNLLRSHCYYQHNGNVGRFVCSVCSKTFHKKSRLETHMRIHNEDRPFSCTVCHRRFHTNGNLQKHVQVHSDDKPFQCQVCSKSFTQKFSLDVHSKRHVAWKDKAPKKVYHCDVCSMMFSRPKWYEDHIMSHSGTRRRLLCTLCDMDFNSTNKLTKHKTEAHPETLHCCLSCDKVFLTSAALRKHSLSHDAGGEAKKSFACSFCGAQFARAASCRDHERQHTGEKPFQCTKCEKRFSSRHNYSQHVRVHSDERPYVCQICGSSFKQRQNLKAHLFVHGTAAEPVKCTDCGKSYRNKMLLMSHKRVHKERASENGSQ